MKLAVRVESNCSSNKNNMGALSSGSAAGLLQFLDEQQHSVIDSVMSQLQLQGVMEAGMGLYFTSSAAPISLQVLAACARCTRCLQAATAAHPLRWLLLCDSTASPNTRVCVFSG